MASDHGRLQLTPATAWYGYVPRTQAHERLWLTDGHMVSPSESMLKLRPCSAWQSGAALPIHTGDSMAWLSQDTNTLNTLQCGATASRTQSGLCVSGLIGHCVARLQTRKKKSNDFKKEEIGQRRKGSTLLENTEGKGKAREIHKGNTQGFPSEDHFRKGSPME